MERKKKLNKVKINIKHTEYQRGEVLKTFKKDRLF